MNRQPERHKDGRKDKTHMHLMQPTGLVAWRSGNSLWPRKLLYTGPG